MHRNLRTQKGFSLIEILLVLGIIAALAIAAFIVYPSVQAGNQAQTETSNLNTIQAGLKNLYTNGRYTGLTETNATTARIVPSNMVQGDFTGGTAPVNVWSGLVTLAPAPDLNGNDTHFSITYEDVTEAACVKLLPAIASNFEAIETTGATPDVLNATGVLSAAGGAQLDFVPANVGDFCDGGGAPVDVIVYGR